MMDLIEKAFRAGLRISPFCTYSRQVNLKERDKIETAEWERWKQENKDEFQSAL